MKTLLSLALVMMTAHANAFETMTCVGNEEYGTSDIMSLTITAIDKTVNDVKEGKKVPYSVLVRKGNKILAAGDVKAFQEDVLFQFSGKSPKYGNMSGSIFMDELNQTTFTLNDTTLHFDCEDQE